MDDTPPTELVQQGLTAARVGDLADARRLLSKATQLTPDNIEAWLGLAGVVESLEEKGDCFRQVLALNPEHTEAQAGLALVEQKLASQDPPPTADSGLTVCYRHPHTETGLRCNRCNNPICPKCAVRTPVGFRCPDCIRAQENKYYSGTNMDYIIAAVIAMPLSFVAVFIFTFILGGLGGFFVIFIGLFAAPATAGIIAEAVRWGVGHRRSRYLGRIVAGCLILATAPFILGMLLVGAFFSLLGPGMLLFLGLPVILARLR